MTEKWLPVVDWEGLYEVSDQGRVRSLDRMVRNGTGTRPVKGRILKWGSSGKPSHRVPIVVLSNGGYHRPRAVHRLVLEAFVGPCPPGLEACHEDDDPFNNHLSNLRWDTHSANMRDRTRNGNTPNANKTHCPHRHEYTADNTLIGSKGERLCRECKRIDSLRRYRADPDRQRRYRREQKRRQRAAKRGHSVNPARSQ